MLRQLLPLWYAGISLFALPGLHAQRVTLLDDGFPDLSNWKDLSLAVDWGNASSPDSAFQIVDSVLQLNPAISGWTSYTSTTGLRTFTAVDFQFPEALNHSSTVLEIGFRVRWRRCNINQKDEGNRFLVTVQHGYPEGGIVLNNPSLVTNPAGVPWARPAYQVRMRGADDTRLDSENYGSTILQYGGGAVPEGEYEYLASHGWWAPGFNSSAYGNGTHSSGAVSPPGEYTHGGPFPFNSWINTPTGLAGTYWQAFRFVIRPDRMELWRDKDETGDWTLEQTLVLPAHEAAPAVALYRGYYHYFEQLEGVRLYWRAASISSSGAPDDQVYLDRIRIEAEHYDSHYQYWLHQHLDAEELAFAGLAGLLEPEADLSGDGIANELVYFMGLDPRERQVPTEVVETVFEPERLIMRYPRSWYVYDIDGWVEWSTDLVNWSREGVEETRLEDTIEPLDPDENAVWRDSYYDRPEVARGAWTIEASVPRPAAGPIFIRLRTERSDG